MAIETPIRKAPAKRLSSDFVICEDFVFRPSDVDGFSHQTCPEATPITVVNFHSYTQTISDPHRKLFDFLVRHSQPKPVDEAA